MGCDYARNVNMGWLMMRAAVEDAVGRFFLCSGSRSRMSSCWWRSFIVACDAMRFGGGGGKAAVLTYR